MCCIFLVQYKRHANAFTNSTLNNMQAHWSAYKPRNIWPPTLSYISVNSCKLSDGSGNCRCQKDASSKNSCIFFFNALHHTRPPHTTWYHTTTLSVPDRSRLMAVTQPRNYMAMGLVSTDKRIWKPHLGAPGAVFDRQTSITHAVISCDGGQG